MDEEVEVESTSVYAGSSRSSSPTPSHHSVEARFPIDEDGDVDMELDEGMREALAASAALMALSSGSPNERGGETEVEEAPGTLIAMPRVPRRVREQPPPLEKSDSDSDMGGDGIMFVVFPRLFDCSRELTLPLTVLEWGEPDLCSFCLICTMPAPLPFLWNDICTPFFPIFLPFP